MIFIQKTILCLIRRFLFATNFLPGQIQCYSLNVTISTFTTLFQPEGQLLINAPDHFSEMTSKQILMDEKWLIILHFSSPLEA